MKHRANPEKFVYEKAKQEPQQRWRSKAEQVAAHLLKDIHEGRWSEWLPSERKLCKLCHVGRNTMRAALAHLSKLKAVKRLHRLGTRIVRQRQRLAAGNDSISSAVAYPLRHILLVRTAENIPAGYGVCEAIMAADKTRKGRRFFGHRVLVPLRAPRGMHYVIRM